MHSSIVEQVEFYSSRNRRRRILKKFVQVLGCIVVFITTYALILPAITMEQTAFCGFEEHTHTDACMEKQYISVLDCTPDKIGVHVHQAECYDSQNVLTCLQPDYVAHIHDNRCFDDQSQLVCTLAERAPHRHDENCYQNELICRDAETVGHSHNESCFILAELDNEVLNCNVEEHIHNLVCYSDSEADVETENVWKATFADAKLSKDLIENLLTIAESQIGYTESSRNYHVGEDHTIHGYTRYGDWYGDPYGEWSGMFAAFCLHYAGEEKIPYDADVRKWIKKLDELNWYVSAEDAGPEKGSLIFFDKDEDGKADRMGIVAETKEATEHTGASMYVIEGDSEKSVRKVIYRPEDKTIVGYVILSDVIRSDHNEDLNADPNNSAAIFEMISVNAKIYTDGTYQRLADDAAEIILTGYIPEDSVVKAYPVIPETEMEILFAYDITIFRSDGSIFEPAEGDVVSVIIHSPVLENTQDDVAVYHISEEGETSLVESEVSDGELSFETSHFSVYAVAKASNYSVAVSPNFGYTYTNVQFSTSGYQTLCALVFNVTGNNWQPVTVTVSSNAFSDAAQPVVYAVKSWETVQIPSTYKNNSVSFTVEDWEFRQFTFAVLIPPTSVSSMTLTEDMVVSEAMYVTKDVTIDLNGHSIRPASGYNGAIFEVTNGNLTIKDSAAPSESSKQTSLNALSAYTASAVADNRSVTVTYYVTDSYITNSANGATTETVYEHTFTSSGVIIAGSGPAISVNGGMVNIESGILYGNNGRAIEAKGNAKINLSGGYICGFHGDNGGAISIDGGSLNISGKAVIAGNHADTRGGAVYASGCTITMSGGIVSGNTVANKSSSNGESGSDSLFGTYGGGGFAIQNCTINLSDGYITNNHSLATGYWSGGGGIYSPGGSTINVSGGYITGNVANSGGGVRTRDYDGGADTFKMTGGYICSNMSSYSEGGGIAIGAGDSGMISGGYINNNYADCRIDWGGGGIFVANSATLQILNVLLTDNEAGGFGGGVAGCSTARMLLSNESGAAIYDNSADGKNLSGAGSTKNADWSFGKNSPVFMANGYDDLYSALNFTIDGSMLGGGFSNWKGSCDGVPVTTNSTSDTIQSQSVLGLTSYPDSSSKTAAQNAATVYINGNYAYTHGGGILCNGYLVMGRSGNMVLGARIEISAGKIYRDLDQVAVEIPDNQFKFEITDKDRNVIATGTAHSNGEIVFSGRLPFSNSNEEEYIYYVYEKSGAIRGIDYDLTKYKITVRVKGISGKSPVSGISITQCVVENIKVERLNTQNNKWTTVSENNPADFEDGPIKLDLGKNTFVNILREVPTDTNVTVNKVWANPEDAVPVVVTLQQNRNAINEVVLSAANNWTHTWEQLPITDDAGNSYEYTAVESNTDEYDVIYTYGVREEDGTPLITITNTRRFYNLEVIKVSDHQSPIPLKGVKFRILNSEDKPLYFVKNPENIYVLSVNTAEGATEALTTDADGKIFISGLKSGNYKVEETEALEG